MMLGPALHAQGETPDAKIVRLLEVSGARDQFLGAIDNIIAMQRQATTSEQIPADFWDAFSQEVHEEGWNEIQPRLLDIYRRNYTEEEIDYQIAYFENPIAQQIVAKQGVIMQESMAVGSIWGQAMGNKISKKLSEAMKDKN